MYLSYVRNNQLKNIPEESEARQMMLKAYDFAVGHVGLDVASGPIWSEYLEFTQSNYYKLVKHKQKSLNLNLLFLFRVFFRFILSGK